MSSFPKHPRYMNENYREFIKTLPCSVESKGCEGQIIPHHCETGGMGMKGSDLSCIPLCHIHHMKLHNKGVTNFKHDHGWYVDFWEARAKTLAEYIEENNL